MPLGRVEIGARAAALWRLYFASNSDTKRAEAEAAIAVLEARKAHSRLRDAIDILPQGIVFLDAEGRYPMEPAIRENLQPQRRSV